MRRLVERTHELHVSQAFAERLLDAIDARVIVVGRDFHIRTVNEKVNGLHGEDVCGRVCYEVLGRRSAPCVACPVARTFATGLPASCERPAHLVGTEEILRQETYPVVEPDGRIEAVIEVARIVTAERQFQSKMMHHERMAAFGLLAAGLAHEIGNPLASMQSQLQRAKHERDPAFTEETLAVIGGQIDRIARLLRDFTSSARQRPEHVAVVSVNQVVEDVARMIGHDRRARSVKIETNLATLPGVTTREDLVMQVLLNLAINALDAMPDGGTLEMSTSVTDGWAVVRVRDTSCGVPEIVRRRLFEPFFTTKEPGSGTGLGLFVSRGIVESLGGHLELEGSGPTGTTFALRLPRSSH